MITPEQSRAARALLNWKQADLAREACVGIVTVRNFEGAQTTPHQGTRKLLHDAFTKAGIVFIDDDGVGAKLLKNP